MFGRCNVYHVQPLSCSTYPKIYYILIVIFILKKINKQDLKLLINTELLVARGISPVLDFPSLCIFSCSEIWSFLYRQVLHALVCVIT